MLLKKIKFGEINGKAVTWTVINYKKENNTAILLADTPLWNEKFDNAKNTWETSRLRQTLNEKLLKEVFSETEQTVIIPYTTLHARNESEQECIDKLFLPSIKQIFQASTKAKISAVQILNAGQPYWLRGRCKLARKSQYVNAKGESPTEGIDCSVSLGVRPCVLVDLTKMNLNPIQNGENTVNLTRIRAKGERTALLKELIREVSENKSLTDDEKEKFLEILDKKLGKLR